MIFGSKMDRARKSQTGIYDETILCAECDGMIGQYDDHAAKNLLQFRGKQLLFDNAGETVLLKYECADPERIWNFAASMAWRASVSTQDFFDRIRLGPYETRIAEALNGNTDVRECVDVFLAEFDMEDVGFLNPYISRFDGVKFLLLFANRFIFHVKLDKQRTPRPFVPAVLRRDAPVLSLVRQWEGSKQAQAMTELVRKVPAPAWFHEAGNRIIEGNA
jgi:hypothetical protein